MVVRALKFVINTNMCHSPLMQEATSKPSEGEATDLKNEIAARKQWPRSSFIGFLRRGPDTDHRAGARATKG